MNMPKIMNLPKIGVNMTEAIITEWAVKEGDTIKIGDLLLNAETDKATQDIYSTDAGIIAKILVQVGEMAQCQEPIAILIEPGEKLDENFSLLNSASVNQGKIETNDKRSDMDTETIAVESPEDAAVIQNGKVRISPLARKVAKDLKVDYRLVSPGRANARIVKADVLAFVETMKKSNIDKPFNLMNPSNTDNGILGTIPLAGIRKIISERMSESNLTKPGVALTLHADAGKLIEWRNQLKKTNHAVSFNDLLAIISARALQEFPIINSKMAEREIQLLRDINIGIAMDSEKGLVVPVIRNADKKGLLEISEEFKMKAERVKNGKSSSEDLTGGTFTITNLGMFEIEQFTPIINPPECCILAVGAIMRQPVVAEESDAIEIRSRMQLTLVFDHRIVDGAPAARFLQRIKHLIEWPMGLIS